MKKCLVCQKGINEKEELCIGCETFFRWKYRKKFKKHLETLREYFLKDSNQLNFGRVK